MKTIAWLLLCSTASAQTLEEIKRIMVEREAATRPFSARYRVLVQRENQTVWGSTYDAHIRAEHGYEEVRRFWYQKKDRPSDSFRRQDHEPFETLTVREGTRHLRLRKTDSWIAPWRGADGKRSAGRVVLESPVAAGLLFADQPVSYWLAHPTALLAGQENIDGFPECVVVDVEWVRNNRVRFWLARNHGYFPVRWKCEGLYFVAVTKLHAWGKARLALEAKLHSSLAPMSTTLTVDASSIEPTASRTKLPMWRRYRDRATHEAYWVTPLGKIRWRILTRALALATVAGALVLFVVVFRRRSATRS